MLDKFSHRHLKQLNINDNKIAFQYKTLSNLNTVYITYLLIHLLGYKEIQVACEFNFINTCTTIKNTVFNRLTAEKFHTTISFQRSLKTTK